MIDEPRYQPVDQLALWYLGEPLSPVPVGTLNLLQTGSRGVSLQYCPSWLETGFALSEDLPLIDREHLPHEKDSAAGAVDDARPDRWGERLIRLVERPPRLSLLKLLYFAGDDRFGALGVSTDWDRYQPWSRGSLPSLGEVAQIDDTVRHILAGDPVPPALQRLVSPGATMGGTRPKALVEVDGQPWILKFGDEPDSVEPLVEHATLTLAKQAGITVVDSRPVRLARGWALAVRRFDRRDGRRIHAQSAHVALRAAGSDLAYPALSQLLRRRGPARNNGHREQMRELFRRLAFNILIDNTDDHEKNHVLLADEQLSLSLSPAFDLLPTGHALGVQSIVVGDAGHESSLDNALSQCQAYGLSRSDAMSELARVVAVIDGWQAHFQACGVPVSTIQVLSQSIDRAWLAMQRTAHRRRTT